MGKKQLKAVAIVRGGHALRAADPRGLIAAADDIAHDLRTDPRRQDPLRVRHAARRREPVELGALPIKNYTTNVTPAST